MAKCSEGSVRDPRILELWNCELRDCELRDCEFRNSIPNVISSFRIAHCVDLAYFYDITILICNFYENRVYVFSGAWVSFLK